MTKTKRKGLAANLAIIIGIMLFVILTIFIAVSISRLQKDIEKATVEELRAIAKSNGIQIQQILNTTESVSSDIAFYLNNAYKNNKQSETEKYDNQSSVYNNLKLTGLGKEIENYIVTTALNCTKNSEDIVGAGVYFEPYTFSDNIESYSFYATSSSGSGSDVINASPSGEYNEFSKKDFYAKAAEKKKVAFSKPYADSSTNIIVITAATPVYYNEKLQCIVAVDIAVDNFEKINVKNEQFSSLSYLIGMADGFIVYHSSNPDMEGENIENTFKNAAEAQLAYDTIDSGKEFFIKCRDQNNKRVYNFFYPIKAGGEVWVAENTVDVKDVNNSARNASILLMAIAVIFFIIIITALIFILKRKLAPIQSIVSVAREIANGNLDTNILVKTDDEIGLLAKTFNDTAQYLKMIIGEISRVLNEIANNNLEITTDVEYRGNFDKIKNSFNNIVDNLNKVMRNINLSALQVSDGSNQVAQGAQTLSEGATDQAGVVQELAASINEIADKINENANDAIKASEKANLVGNEINESNQQMKELMQAISEISNASNAIEKIIKTIEEIASQTNLLSLNAAIEAARAGEAGKGFAVVAEEIRVLAAESADAAKDTTQLIANSMKAVENGTKIADITEKSLLSVVEGVKEVSQAIQEIAKDSNVQADSIKQLTSGVDQIANVVQDNSSTAQESASASEELSNQAKALQNLVQQFNLKEEEN